MNVTETPLKLKGKSHAENALAHHQKDVKSVNFEKAPQGYFVYDRSPFEEGEGKVTFKERTAIHRKDTRSVDPQKTFLHVKAPAK